MKAVSLALRSIQFLMALLIMALTGNAIAMGANSDINNYTMFCAAWAMLFLIYLIPAALNDSWVGHHAVPFVIDIFSTIFWFCAAVALASELGVHSCNNYLYTSTNQVTSGASDTMGACREGQASDAFLWFGFAAFVGSTVISGMTMSGHSSTSGIRRGPAMSQV